MQTAIFNGHYGFAAMLLERGADANDGSLYVAVEMRNLAHYTNRPNPPDSDGKYSHLDVIKLLLAKGADPNLPYTKKIPPRQAQGNITVPPGATPLYRAVRSIDMASVQALLEKGANPATPIKDGSTPLMAAAGLGAPRMDDEEVTDPGDRSDPVAMVKLLLEKGADVKAVNALGNTALHYAMQRGSAPMIQLLVDHGASDEVKNKRGQTPKEMARR
jgi:ankyrin repeat protein